MGFSRQECWSEFHDLLRGSSQSRDQSQASRIAGGFFYQLSYQGSPKKPYFLLPKLTQTLKILCCPEWCQKGQQLQAQWQIWSRQNMPSAGRFNESNHSSLHPSVWLLFDSICTVLNSVVIDSTVTGAVWGTASLNLHIKLNHQFNIFASVCEYIVYGTADSTVWGCSPWFLLSACLNRW